MQSIDSYYWQLLARIVDPKWEKYSLGPTGNVSMVKMGIEENIKNIEAGLGHYEYKLKLGALEFPAIIIRITRKEFISRIKSKIILNGFYLINIAYYKIWFKRIQSVLPKYFQRSLWMFWIRLM